MIHLVLLGLGIATLAGVVAMAVQLIVGGSRIPRLSDQVGDPNGPSVSVIVAARDEAHTIERALRSLLDQKYGALEIIAINDRSSDGTGAILKRVAEREPRLHVVRVKDLPPHWLGKNHALHIGAGTATGEYLLFTDADVVFEPDAIAKAMGFLRAQRLDHLTVGPELDSPSRLLSLVVNFFALGFLLYYRPWHAENPARSEHMGVGAFNLVRTTLYRNFGGHSRIALRPDDDIKLGRLVKLAGGRQMVAGGLGTICVRWYSTVGELARGLRKNTYAGLNYNFPMALGAIVVQLAVNVWPFVALFVTSGAIWWMNAGVAFILMAMYALVARSGGSKVWLAIGYPIAAIIFVYIVIAALWYTLSRGGIEWRGTFYRLDELRANKV